MTLLAAAIAATPADTACLRVPASIPDADAILTCYGGPDWRSLALLGAGFLVVAVMVLAAVVVLALVIAGKRS